MIENCWWQFDACNSCNTLKGKCGGEGRPPPPSGERGGRRGRAVELAGSAQKKKEKGKKRGRVPGLPVCLPTIPYYSVETHKWKQIGHEIKSKLTLSIRVDLTPNSAGQITCNQMNQRERWRKRSTGHALPTLVPAREGWLKFWALSDFNNRVHTFGCRSQRWNTQTLHCRIWSWITLEFLQFVGFFFFPVRFPNHSHVTQCRLAM